MPNPIELLRTALSQASLLSVSAQTGLAEALNTSSSLNLEDGESAALTPYLDPAREIVKHFWRGVSPTPEQGPVMSWTRWTGLQQDSGLAALLRVPKRRMLFLPTVTEPVCLNLQAPPSEPWLRFLPDPRTVKRYGSTKLIYAQLSSLAVAAYLDQCQDDYKMFMSHGFTPASQVPPTLCFRPDGAMILEDYRDAPYRAVAAAQLGFQHLLCSVIPSFSASGDMVAIHTLAASYPSIQARRTAQQTADTIPSTRYFGGVHPERGPVTTKISGAMNLYDRNGVAIGEAQILAGGAEGQIAFPEFGLSAATSVGEAPVDPEETREQEDGCLIAHAQIPGIPWAFFEVGFDGLGGAPWGEVAQSAALQGVHACLVAALAEGRIPYPQELLEAAARAADAQVRLLEEKQGKKFDRYQQPDAVGSVVVMIGDVVLMGVVGDFPVLISEQKNDGSLHTVAYTTADVTPEYYVFSTVRSRNARYYAFRMKPNVKTWINTLSDGALHNILDDFKVRMSQELRKAYVRPLPDQSLFYNFDTLLARATPVDAAQRLHDVALNGMSWSQNPGLLYVNRQIDNLTVLSKYVDAPETTGVNIPQGYQPMEEVMKPRQFHYETTPNELNIPETLSEIFLGRTDHPDGKTMMVIPQSDLAALHARIFREGDGYFVEPASEEGRLEIRRGGMLKRLTKPGERFALESRDQLSLSNTVSLEIFVPEDDESDKTPTMRPK